MLGRIKLFFKITHFTELGLEPRALGIGGVSEEVP